MTTTLHGITWEHARGHGSLVAAAETYRAVRPDVEVLWEFRSLQAFADHPIERLVETYDLLVIDHPHIPRAAEHGLFARLDGQGFDDELAVLATQSVGRSHESYIHDGHQWGLATDAAAQVAAFRPDLIAEPPRDWEAVLALAREGRVLWPTKPIDAFSSLVTIAANSGTPPMSEPGIFLTLDQAMPALELMRELFALVPPDNITWNPIQAADALSQGDRWAYVPLLFGYTNYSRAGSRPNRIQYIDIPRGARGVDGSLLGGAGIAVSARTNHLEEAIAHAFWLDSAEVQEGVYYDGGGQPGNATAWDSDRTNADSFDFFRGTRRTLEGAYLRPRTVRYIELQNALSPLVTLALAGGLNNAQLVSRLNDGVTDFLVED